MLYALKGELISEGEFVVVYDEKSSVNLDVLHKPNILSEMNLFFRIFQTIQNQKFCQCVAAALLTSKGKGVIKL